MFLQHLQDNLIFLFSQVRLQDALDLFLVWLIVYRLLVLIRKTGTVQMLSGLGVLAVAYILSIWIDLFTLNWILEKFFQNLFVIVVILFQGEIRRALAQIGANPFFTDISHARETEVIEEIAKGVMSTSHRGHGGLIVLEKDIAVDYHIEFGIELDSKISSEVLLSIFHPHSPIHDGAVLIRAGKIHSAGCILPLSKNPALDKNLGTRHRAALGLTEETDALVLVISEENKSVGLVQSGQLQPQVDMVTLRRALYDFYDLKFKVSAAGDIT